MAFTNAEITAWVGAFLWPFIRISALVYAAPVLGTRNVPNRLKILLSVTIAAIVAPQLENLPQLDPLSLSSWMLIAQQILIGVAMGLALHLVFTAIIIGGQIIALQMGLGFASMVDPSNGLQVPMVSQLYLLLTMLVFTAMNGHLILIQVLVETFQSMPISVDGLSADSMWKLVAWGSEMFAGAVIIAAPTVASLLIVNIAFGVMTRAAPQLNIFAIGFPIMVTVGFVLMMISLPSVVPQSYNMVNTVFDLIRDMTGLSVQ